MHTVEALQASAGHCRPVQAPPPAPPRTRILNTFSCVAEAFLHLVNICDVILIRKCYRDIFLSSYCGANDLFLC